MKSKAVSSRENEHTHFVLERENPTECQKMGGDSAELLRLRRRSENVWRFAAAVGLGTIFPSYDRGL